MRILREPPRVEHWSTQVHCKGHLLDGCGIEYEVEEGDLLTEGSIHPYVFCPRCSTKEIFYSLPTEVRVRLTARKGA